MNIKTLSVTIVLAAIILIAFPSESHSQRVMKNYNEAITANPLALAFGIFNVNYEMQVSRENSLTIGATYYGYQGWTGVGLQGIYKWYLFQDADKAIKGFGFGPSASIGYIGYRDATYANRMTLAIGAEATYKWIFDDFVLEPVFGINYNVLVEAGMDWRPFYLGVNVGYAW